MSLLLVAMQEDSLFILDCFSDNQVLGVPKLLSLRSQIAEAVQSCFLQKKYIACLQSHDSDEGREVKSSYGRHTEKRVYASDQIWRCYKNTTLPIQSPPVVTPWRLLTQPATTFAADSSDVWSSARVNFLVGAFHSTLWLPISRVSSLTPTQHNKVQDSTVS